MVVRGISPDEKSRKRKSMGIYAVGNTNQYSVAVTVIVTLVTRQPEGTGGLVNVTSGGPAVAVMVVYPEPVGRPVGRPVG